MTNWIGTTAMERQIQDLIGSSVEAMGYDLVRVRFSSGGKPTLQIMAERQDGENMTVEDCADLSRAISALMEVEDPISGAYDLEISSPGLDRPLTRLQDFENYLGYEVTVKVGDMIDGRKKFKGPLQRLEDDHVVLEQEGQEYKLTFDNIKSAKLVLTDELFAQSLKQA